jgi:hypothetical protein
MYALIPIAANEKNEIAAIPAMKGIDEVPVMINRRLSTPYVIGSI